MIAERALKKLDTEQKITMEQKELIVNFLDDIKDRMRRIEVILMDLK